MREHQYLLTAVCTQTSQNTKELAECYRTTPPMIKEADLVQAITIDFETYYSKKFSLSKLTTEEYINDSQFEVIGVGVKINMTRYAIGYSDLIGSIVALSRIMLCLMLRY